ncbi:MAG: hypothetical protein Kow0063_36790 [Anaerolineae bacterium]
MLLLLMVGFWLRLSLLLGSVYHIDEFITMLAATRVAEHGLPILPSGLFYDHGLILSFIMGAFIALIGFGEEVARWPVLLVSVFTIAAYYFAARRLFCSRIAGFIAATLAAFDTSFIIWGTRARMYSPAHLFVLLGLVFLLEGVLGRPNRRSRYLSLVFWVAALFSHTITFVLLPPLGLLLLVFTLASRREWLRQPGLWQEALVAMIALAAVLSVVAAGLTGSAVSLQDPYADAVPPPGLEFLRGFFAPGLEWSRFDNLIGFFEATEYQWLLPVIAMSLLVTLYRVLRRKATFADVASLFVALLVVLVIFEMGALLTDSWSISRYLFFLVLPAFFLLSAESLARLLGGVIRLTARLFRQAGRQQLLAATMPLLGMALVAAWVGPAAVNVAQAQGTGNYHTAFAFVRESWQPGDKVMTFHPAAAYLYLGRCDYYANQVTAKVLRDERDEAFPRDLYTGSLLIDSVEKLNAALDDGHRIWFVVDQFRLFNRYEPFFTQQVFAQMDQAHRAGEVYVFISRPHPVPLPAEPAGALGGNFDNLIRLEGYSWDPASIAPDGTMSLGLYWRPIGTPSHTVKVFVQLRNGQGQTIAQADHFIYEGLLTLEEWNRLREGGEWLRDSADLRIPLPLPAGGGPYRIYVGLYDPVTLERVPVLNDMSGENAVVIDLAAPQ